MADWSIRFPDSEDTEESQTQNQEEEQNELSTKTSELIRRAPPNITSPILFSSPHVSPQSRTATGPNSWPSSSALHINPNNSHHGHTFEDTENKSQAQNQEQNELSLKLFELIKAAAAQQPTQNSVALFPSPPPTTSPILFSSPHHLSPQSQQTAAASNSSGAAQTHINVNNTHTFESPLQALQAQEGTTNFNLDIGNLFTSNSNKELVYDEPEQEDLDRQGEDSLEDVVDNNENENIMTTKKRHHTGPIRNQYIEGKRARQSSKSKRKITLQKKAESYFVNIGEPISIRFPNDPKYDFNSHPTIYRNIGVQVGESSFQVQDLANKEKHTPKKIQSSVPRTIINNLPGKKSPNKKVTTRTTGKCSVCSLIWESKADKTFRKKHGARKTTWVGCDFPGCKFWAHAKCAGFFIKPRIKVDNQPFLCKSHRK